MKKLLIILFAFSAVATVAAPPAKPRLGEAPVRKIVAAMNLEENASLLVGASMEDYAGEGAVTGRTLKVVPGSAGTTCSPEAYGIPPTVMADGRMTYAVERDGSPLLLPSALGLVAQERNLADGFLVQGIAIDTHEPIKDTGIRRTWPNMMTREGTRGMEWNGDNSSCCIQTTLARQIANWVIIYSPLQMAADLIENYEGHPAFRLFRDFDADCDWSEALQGEPEDYIVVARRPRRAGRDVYSRK